MAIAIGLFAVAVWNRVSTYFDEIPVDLPQVESEVPFYIFVEQNCHPISCGGGGSVTDENLPSEQYRDLAQYDHGRDLEQCVGLYEMETQRCQEDWNQARRFIAEHWIERKRAYVVVHYPCGRDNCWTEQDFVEPDEGAQWRIVRTLRKGNDGIEELPTVFRVRFRRVTMGERPDKSSSTVLSFLNNRGREIDTF